MISLFKKSKNFVFFAFLILVTFSNGIIAVGLWKAIEYPYKRLNVNDIDSSNGIVVLSGGVGEERFLAGLNLYKANKADKLIFTGGQNPVKSSLPTIGEKYIEQAILRGLQRNNLFTTYKIKNTYQEAKAIKVLLEKKLQLNSKNIILVTSAYHMKRAKTIFEREGFVVEPFPVNFTIVNSFNGLITNPLNWIPSSGSLRKSSTAIREIIGRIVYRAF